MTQSTPDLPIPEPCVYLVDVEERSRYVVRVTDAHLKHLNLPPGTPESAVTEAIARTAEVMVTNGHPDAIRHDSIRTVGDITRLPPTG